LVLSQISTKALQIILQGGRKEYINERVAEKAVSLGKSGLLEKENGECLENIV
jgi:hypothetical protein